MITVRYGSNHQGGHLGMPRSAPTQQIAVPTSRVDAGRGHMPRLATKRGDIMGSFDTITALWATLAELIAGGITFGS
ncbi:hypothetical protein G3I13_03390 [Streptomyces sp. SID6673]|nr:hypothetical protein [Streptomyces sp. SID11726]NEB23367.1 hypothetical protein [Streptomyces sp. SID6673]